MNLTANGLDVDSLAVRVDGLGCCRLPVAPVEIGQTREQPFPLLFLLFFSFSIFVRFHSFRWLAGAREKTLVREAGLDRAENSGSGGDFREEASKGSAQIEVWQDFFHASECSVMWGRVSPSSFRWSEGWIALFGIGMWLCQLLEAGEVNVKRC
ncbi:hypothetical protein Taro_014440 [Colocasia esculenta]|uniref:Uncharacterized protein n=1 Tax=Colocasia esculenta TaxID=4460 RepID=A0A843UER9_COLES|nr:hypothetical protein [Colocasia esculenta]